MYLEDSYDPYTVLTESKLTPQKGQIFLLRLISVFPSEFSDRNILAKKSIEFKIFAFPEASTYCR